jgi:hypothetical protein
VTGRHSAAPVPNATPALAHAKAAITPMTAIPAPPRLQIDSIDWLLPIAFAVPGEENPRPILLLAMP